MRNLYAFLTLCLCLLYSSFSFGQVNITPGGGAATLANAVASNGSTLSNVQLNCYADTNALLPTVFHQYGYGQFASGATNLGLPGGVVLTTGYVEDAASLNLTGGQSRLSSGLCDQDLNNEFVLTDSCCFRCTTSIDVCILEFDIEVPNDRLFADYVFASEEYMEFVCSEYNDVFAIFLSGPGITGMQNIARLPDGVTRVEINSINDGALISNFPAANCVSLTNTGFFVDNTPGAGGGAGLTIEYDGFTTPLRAEATVNPCDTYHMKFAIGDVSDRVFDSAVFIEEQSIGTYELDVVHDGFTVFEGCNTSSVTFTRDPVLSVPSTLNYTIAGTATNGTDFPLLSGTITIPADSASASITIDAVNDSTTEGAETLIISLEDCSNQVYDQVIVPIEDCVTLENETLGLSARQIDKSVSLGWAHLDLAGITYLVEKSTNGSPFMTLESIHPEEGISALTFLDESVMSGQMYAYRIHGILPTGEAIRSNTVELSVFYSEPLTISSFYPQPSKGAISLDVNSPETDYMSITLFNNLGKKVFSNVTDLPEGFTQIQLDIKHLPTGSYYAQIRTADQYFEQKLMLIK